MNLNRVMLAGNLTRDPEGKSLNSGSFVASFGIAINRKWKNAAGEAQEEVVFVDCEAWSKTGEVIAKHFTKGKAILVEGRLKLETWDDAKGGGKRSKLKVVVENFHFVGAKGDGAMNPQATGAAPRTETRTAPPADDWEPNF